MDAEEKKVQKTNRELMMEGLASRHPDGKWDDDEAALGQMNTDYDDLGKQLEDYKGREKAMSDLITSDHRGAGLLKAMKDGEDPVVYLVREYGPEIAERSADKEFQEKLEAAGKDYAQRLAESKELDDKYNANVAETIKVIDAFQEENGLSDEETDAIMDALKQIVEDRIVGKISKETLVMISKAINHDTDVAQADKDGEIRGRNANIQQQMRHAKKGDGTPGLDGANGGSGAPANKPDLGAIGRYDSRNIFERGGEKRKRY